MGVAVEIGKGADRPETCGAAPAPSVSLQRVTRIALLAAVALVLSYVETTIPLPLVFPGAKLGLANIAVLVALFAFDARTAVPVAVVKVLAAGFLFGSPLMLAYSLGGTVLALGAMLLLRLVPGVSVTVVSMASAVFHNAGQVLVACALFGTPAVLVSFPPLAVVALVTGWLTGMAAKTVLVDRAFVDGVEAGGGPGEADARTGEASALEAATRSDGAFRFGVYRAGDSLAHRLDPRAKLTFVLVFFAAAFAAQGPLALAAVAVVAFGALAASKARCRQVLAWLRPFVWLLLLVAAFDVMFTRTGTVLWETGIVTATTDGFLLAVESVIRFACMLLGTSSLMFTTSLQDLTAGIGGMLAPLKRLGIRVDDAVLALSLTMQFIPVVSDEFARAKREQDAGMAEAESTGLIARLHAYAKAFSPVFSRALREADELSVRLSGNGGYSVKTCTGRFSASDGVAVLVAVALAVLEAAL